MAILTSDQLVEIRRGIADEAPGVNYIKAQINTAIQAVENWFEANRASLNQAINTSTSPLVLTAQQKKFLVVYWMLQKYGRERL